MEKKLHIGGTEQKEGWVILNALPGPGVDYVGDFRDLSQFPQDYFSDIYLSHVLEHIGHYSVGQTLSGIHRILQPAGKLYISVPDLDILCHYFSSPYSTADQKYLAMRIIFGNQSNNFDFHYTGFNEVFLRHFLHTSGFQTAQRVDSFGLFSDTSEYSPFGFKISLNMIATK
ncbi:MAG: class I SAM-dependent methyltransferase [Betaproteobacteria bacterium]|jgi:predicted SAM-dependent methyltransferase